MPDTLLTDQIDEHQKILWPEITGSSLWRCEGRDCTYQINTFGEEGRASDGSKAVVVHGNGFRRNTAKIDRIMTSISVDELSFRATEFVEKCHAEDATRRSTLVRSSVCECGFRLMREGVETGEEYTIHPNDTKSGRLICGGCGRTIDLVFVYTDSRGPRKGGYVPMSAFEVVEEATQNAASPGSLREESDLLFSLYPQHRAVLEKRMEIASSWCTDHGKDLEHLCMDDLLEIRSLPAWKDANGGTEIDLHIDRYGKVIEPDASSRPDRAWTPEDVWTKIGES